MKTDKKISAIKIDIENFEFYALDGAQQLLTKHKPVVYAELWENENRQKSFELMKNLGYEINIVEKNKLTPFRSEQHPTQNFIFIHPNG